MALPAPADPHAETLATQLSGVRSALVPPQGSVRTSDPILQSAWGPSEPGRAGSRQL